MLFILLLGAALCFCTPPTLCGKSSSSFSDFSKKFYNELQAHHALIAAIEAGDTATTRQLLEAGTSANSGRTFGCTPLMAATKLFAQKHDAAEPMVNLLLAHGADLEACTVTGTTALLHAAQNNTSEAITCFVAYKANVNHRSSLLKEYSALTYAARHGNEAAVRLLLENGAHVTWYDFAVCTENVARDATKTEYLQCQELIAQKLEQNN